MSHVLVIAQFTCIAVLIFGGAWNMPWWAWALFGSGLLVFTLAAMALGRNNFTVMPDPRRDNTLSVRGIYRYLRHPMYTAVLLCGIAVSSGAPSIWRFAALAACLVVLVLKIRYEEGQLTERYPDYPQRMGDVARLIPGVW